MTDTMTRDEVMAAIGVHFMSSGHTYNAITTLYAERDALTERLKSVEAENERLRDALQWMVDNDETNEGDEPVESLGGQSWNEYNAYWIEGLNKARAALNATTGEGHE